MFARTIFFMQSDLCIIMYSRIKSNKKLRNLSFEWKQPSEMYILHKQRQVVASERWEWGKERERKWKKFVQLSDSVDFQLSQTLKINRKSMQTWM